MRNSFLWLLTLIFISCTVTHTPKIPIHTEILPINEQVADSLWSLRADSELAFASLHMFQELAELDSTSIERWTDLARAYYYCSQYLTPSAVTRDSLFLLGHEASQVILKQNSEYRDLLFSTGDERIAIRGLDEKFLESLYWGMANYGQWLATKSSIVRMGQRELFWVTLDHINNLDSNFHWGAYYRYKGALLRQDPTTENDTLAIKEAFEMAISIAPDYLGNYTLMAQYYCPLAGDKNLFYQLLTKVVTATPNPDLPYYPENMAEKVIADRLMIKAEKENWFGL